MSLNSVFNIAGSSLSSQAVRLNTTASNMANSESVASSKDGVYKPRLPVFSPKEVDKQLNFFENQRSWGVQVDGIIEKDVEAIAIHSPDHPMADDEGYIYKANVNMMEEMANMISASRSYQNSVEVFNTTKNMITKTLQLGG
jgi:flagellar basal-body rod protein FlgC